MCTWWRHGIWVQRSSMKLTRKLLFKTKFFCNHNHFNSNWFQNPNFMTIFANHNIPFRRCHPYQKVTPPPHPIANKFDSTANMNYRTNISPKWNTSLRCPLTGTQNLRVFKQKIDKTYHVVNGGHKDRCSHCEDHVLIDHRFQCRGCYRHIFPVYSIDPGHNAINLLASTLCIIVCLKIWKATKKCKQNMYWNCGNWCGPYCEPILE